jgi:hypothetical protein
MRNRKSRARKHHHAYQTDPQPKPTFLANRHCRLQNISTEESSNTLKFSGQIKPHEPIRQPGCFGSTAHIPQNPARSPNRLIPHDAPSRPMLTTTAEISSIAAVSNLSTALISAEARTANLASSSSQTPSKLTEW